MHQCSLSGMPVRFAREHAEAGLPAQANPSTNFRPFRLSKYFGDTTPVANRGELSYFWAVNCESGNSIAAPESRAHRLSLAARGRDGRFDCAVCVSRVSLGDQTDLRRTAR